MTSQLTIGVIGDFNPELESHHATNNALQHSAVNVGASVDVKWLPTASFIDLGCPQAIQGADALLASPGGPYRSHRGVQEAIRFARERGIPFLGT